MSLRLPSSLPSPPLLPSPLTHSLTRAPLFHFRYPVLQGVQDVFQDISRRLPAPVEASFGEVADLRSDRNGGSGKGEGKGKKEGGCC